MAIYIDEIFLVNSMSCAAMLCSLALLSKRRCAILRLVGSSMLCGIYASAEIILDLPHSLRLLMLAIIAFAAFGRYGVARNTAALMLLCFITGGVVMAASAVTGAAASLAGGTVTLFAPEPFVAIIYALSWPGVVLGEYVKRCSGRFFRVRLRYKDKPLSFIVMNDSGNMLMYHGRPVIIVSYSAVASLFDCDNYERLKETATEFAFYGTIGESGVMPVFVPDICIAKGKPSDAVIGVTEREFKKGCAGVAGDF